LPFCVVFSTNVGESDDELDEEEVSLGERFSSLFMLLFNDENDKLLSSIDANSASTSSLKRSKRNDMKIRHRQESVLLSHLFIITVSI
jgi:hypothetical protein